MWEWIVVVLLYASGIGFFRLIGGVGAASEAIQRWGRATAVKRAPKLRRARVPASTAPDVSAG